MNKQIHNCKYSDLMITQGNDEEFISCMKCQKEYTYEEAKELEKKQGSFLKCEWCGKQDKTVEKLFCGFQLDVNDTEVEEIICSECESEHLDDI